MGYTRVVAVLSNPLGRAKRQEIELLADTGAMYTMLPESTLKGLDVMPTGKRRFKLASGELKEYATGEVYVDVEGVGVTTVVIFGPEASTPLLGVTTLELLGLQVDPVNGGLKPLELLLV